jgi:hypothetical protein
MTEGQLLTAKAWFSDSVLRCIAEQDAMGNRSLETTE